jgi:hypothetical protein
MLTKIRAEPMFFEALKYHQWRLIFTAMEKARKAAYHQKPISSSVRVDHRGATTMMMRGH